MWTVKRATGPRPVKCALDRGSWAAGLLLAKPIKPWPYLSMRQMKIDTLFQAQTQKITPYAWLYIGKNYK